MDAVKNRLKADSNTSKGKGEKKDSSASGGADGANKEPDYVYATTTVQPDRTLFVVDLSRLKAERDTLENALVLYRPEADIKKIQYEQRCSQLVGLALCTMNFTGKYPEYIRLRGTSYAIRSLGDTYLMGLSSRIDEPPLCTVHFLKTLHDMFHFFYKSTDNLLRKCMDDWEIFTNTMSSIFNKLLCYLIRDQHSVPSMLSPIPYATFNYEKMRPPSQKRNRSRLYMLASRVLKACQGHGSVLGGVILHNSAILTSQFPPALTEKIAVVGGGAIALDQCSILEDNVAPGKVWVIEVHLFDEDVVKAKMSRKNHSKINGIYSTLHSNASPGRPHVPLSLSFTPPAAPKRTHGNWRNKITSHSPPPLPNRSTSLRPGSAGDRPPPPPTRDPPTRKPYSTSSVPSQSSGPPLASGTPHSRMSITSEDAVQLSPGLTRVQFNTAMTSSKKKPHLAPIVIPPPDKKRQATAAAEDDYEDIDDLIGVDPGMALPARVLSNRGSQVGAVPATNGTGSFENDDSSKSTNSSPLVEQKRPSTGSISSDGFKTPPPILPQRSNEAGLNHSIYDDHHDDGGQEGSRKNGVDDDGYETIDHASLATKEAAPSLSRTVSEMTDDEIEKLVNTPISLPQNDRPQVAMLLTKRPPQEKVPALPSEMRSWKFKAATDPDSDSDNDFVNSTELQEMLLANQLDRQQTETTSSSSMTDGPSSAGGGGEDKERGKRSSATPSPPPLPPREYTLSIMRKSTNEADVKLPVATVVGQLSKQTVIPPLHVRHVTGVGPGVLYSEHDIDGGAVASHDTTDGGHSAPSWLYSDDLDHLDANGRVSEEVGKATPTSGLDNDTPTTNGANGEILSTEQVEIEVPSDKKENEKAKSSPKTSPKSSPATQRKQNGNLTDISARPNPSGHKPDTLSEVDRKISSSVDVEARAVSGTATLSLPRTIEEGASTFTMSITSDDVFSNSLVVAADGKSRTTERRENGEGEEKREENLQQESGGFETETLKLDDIDVNVQHGNNNEESVSLRLASVATDLDLSMATEEESITRDGTVTPVQMTLNESMVNMIRYRPDRANGDGAAGEDEGELLESAEYSSLPEDEDDEEGEMDAGSKTSTRTDLTEMTYEALGRPRAKSWLTKTMRRTPSSKVKLEKKCLYIQGYMSTMVVLLADSGLHEEHDTLNQLWRSLLPQLLDLDAGLKGEEVPPNQAKPQNYVVTYSKFDRHCEANPRTASFQYRHALRRLHQEYDKDPTLLQASLCKESYVRLLGQRIHDREVYFQPGKLGGSYDALSMSGALERIAKTKTSLRQQPPGGPKVMIV